MRRTNHLTATLVALALLLAACGGSTNQTDDTAATTTNTATEPEYFINNHDTEFQFGTGLAEWVGFSEAVVTFRVVGDREGSKMDIGGNVFVQQILTLEVDEVVWRAPSERAKVPERLDVLGPGYTVIDGQTQRTAALPVVGRTSYLGALTYHDSEWTVLQNSVVRLDESQRVATEGDLLTGQTITDVRSQLARTLPAEYVDLSIVDPIERKRAQEEAQYAATPPEPEVLPEPGSFTPREIDWNSPDIRRELGLEPDDDRDLYDPEVRKELGLPPLDE